MAKWLMPPPTPEIEMLDLTYAQEAPFAVSAAAAAMPMSDPAMHCADSESIADARLESSRESDTCS